MHPGTFPEGFASLCHHLPIDWQQHGACYGRAVSFPHSYCALSPTKLGVRFWEVSRGRGGHEGWGPHDGIGALTRRDTAVLVFRLSQALSPPVPQRADLKERSCEHWENVAVSNPKGALPGTQPCSCLEDPPPPELWENTFLLGKPTACVTVL